MSCTGGGVADRGIWILNVCSITELIPSNETPDVPWNRHDPCQGALRGACCRTLRLSYREG